MICFMRPIGCVWLSNLLIITLTRFNNSAVNTELNYDDFYCPDNVSNIQHSENISTVACPQVTVDHFTKPYISL